MLYLSGVFLVVQDWVSIAVPVEFLIIQETNQIIS